MQVWDLYYSCGFGTPKLKINFKIDTGPMIKLKFSVKFSLKIFLEMKFTFIQIKNLIDTLDRRSDRTEEGSTKKTDLRKLPQLRGEKKING